MLQSIVFKQAAVYIKLRVAGTQERVQVYRFEHSRFKLNFQTFVDWRLVRTINDKSL